MTLPSLPDAKLGTAIPRLLHQICVGQAVPGALLRNVEQLANRNPGWSHQLYDDAAIERFILKHFGLPVLNYYKRISPDYAAARADLFRYLALYKLGGVYLDLKSSFSQPIDDVLRGDEQYVISRWRNGPGEPHQGWGIHGDLADIPGGEIQQWHVIAAPGHPFLRAVIETVLAAIEHYDFRQTGVGWIGVLRTTGPIAYTRAITPLLALHPCRIITDETVLGLEYTVLPQSSHQGTFSGHYTQNATPVVRHPGVRGWIDVARRSKDRLKGHT